MLFAGAVDEGTLFVFDTVELATACCEGIDVEDGVWRFWDEEGHALRAEFSVPNYRGSFTVGNGVFHLVPDPTGQPLISAISSFRSMEPNHQFSTLQAIFAKLGNGRPRVDV
jgi:hypothetical protein